VHLSEEPLREHAPAAGHPKPAPSADPTATTQQYVVRFWPRVLSFYQQTVMVHQHGHNRLLAPEEPMDWQYRAVVAINDDTLYASTFVDTRDGGIVVLQIPKAGTNYSLLVLDVFGNRIEVPVPTNISGVYALVSPTYTGEIPGGAQKIVMQYPVTIWNFRADKCYNGVDTSKEADEFRQALIMNGQETLMLPVASFDVSVKETADELALDRPRALLELMRKAVTDGSTTPVLSPGDLDLSAQFNAAFDAAVAAELAGNYSPMLVLTRAVIDAWQSIQAHWRNLAGPTGWIHPLNFAAWGTDYPGRAAGNEFIQYGNNAAAAGYWHTFVDKDGAALRCIDGHTYQITFPAGQIPQADRFWSLTAYTPDSIELIKNDAKKYVVASYMNPVKNADGSITVYISQQPPADNLRPNWLPVDDKKFNIMLRVYGPTGNTAPGVTYNPPTIIRH
jgi:hypothetical protein